jgi:SSS family solute:Na+ symporter
MHVSLPTLVGLATLPLYFLVTLVIGWLSRSRTPSANSYLNASRSMPLPIVTAAYVAANCGALEIVGLSALAAQYGVSAFHFYWIGAIPAMIFLALFMMPVYRRSGVRSVPEYLEVRYGPRLRLLNSAVLSITMLLLGGISLYAMAQVLAVVAGLNFNLSVLLFAGVVLVYVLLGGIRATIYNEVFQLAVMLAGLIPLAVHSWRIGATSSGPDLKMHLWQRLPFISQASSTDAFGTIFGLGAVLSFAYWCTDFVQMQRAFAARSEREARQVPLWAGFGKLAFSFIVVLPGLAAFRVFPSLGHTQRFDQALPQLMLSFYGPAMLGLGITALVASLMSSLASNVSAFAALFTEDLYRARLRPGRAERHYLTVGRISIVIAIAFSMSASYLNFFFGNLMEHVQLIFSIFGAPFWAIFLLGMGTRRTTERGAIVGFLSGTAVALLHLIATGTGWLHYGSIMNGTFHVAVYSFLTALIVGWTVSTLQRDPAAQQVTGLVFHWRTGCSGPGNGLLWTLSVILLAVCVVLNILWR